MIEQPTNANYAAEVVRLPAPRKHSNADKLQCWSVLGANVITSLEAQEGDLMVYFPPECELSAKFLSSNNMYRHEYLNGDAKTKGYFEDNGRVKAIKLRGEQSEGMVMPVASLSCFGNLSELKPGVVFDKLNGQMVCKKYFRGKVQVSNPPGTKKNNKIKKFSRVIESQFNFHKDTHQFKRNLHAYEPNDFITITNKVHGTSSISSHVLVNRKLSTWEKIKQTLKLPVQTTEYFVLYSSRSVVKNCWDTADPGGWYKTDVWGSANDLIKDKLPEGYTLYYEIVGYLPGSTRCIQKGYDYGCKPGEFEIYVYRGTYTSPTGEVIEFSTPQLVALCERMELKHVPVLWQGYLRDIEPEGDMKTWHDRVLAKLTEIYLEKDCTMCVNTVPAEGVVIRKEYVAPHQWFAHKLKAFRFLMAEGAAYDAGEANIEDDQVVEEEEAVVE